MSRQSAVNSVLLLDLAKLYVYFFLITTYHDDSKRSIYNSSTIVTS